MGHRFESLSLSARMVAWHGAGLELVHKDMLGDVAGRSTDTSSADSLVDGGQTDAPLEQETVVPSEPRRTMHEQIGRDGQDGDRMRVDQVGPTSGRQIRDVNEAQQTPAHVDMSGSAGPSATFSPESSGMRGETNPPGRTTEPCAWIGPFLYALDRLKLPVRAMWTYWELALDFGGEPDGGRRQLWANIIKSLPYKQRVGFWPLSELHDGVMLAKPALFWQGVREFGATHVLCFGRRACMTLFPDRPFTPGVFQHDDLTVVILPGPDDMLPDNREAKAVAWGLLKNLRI